MKELIEVDYIKNDLKPSWFIEQPIDFEYKVYTLMAFLKRAEENIYNGYWFPEFDIIEKRFKDIESFKESSDVVYANTVDKELFEYIYDLPKNSVEYAEVIKIAEYGYSVLGDIYYELKSHIDYLIANMKVFNRIKDRRVTPTYFIEKCDSGVVEKYKVSKHRIESHGSFQSDNYAFLLDEENYVQVISDISIDSDQCLIPITKKLIELGDCF